MKYFGVAQTNSRLSPILLHWLQNNSLFPIKHIRILHLHDGTPESPQEHCHKSTWTLMSLQEHKIIFYTPNQLEMKPDSPALASEPSRGPVHLRKETQGPSDIPVAEGKLHLRCWWKVGSNLKSKTGNHISSWDDMGYMELSSSCCTDINIHIDLRRVSQGISFDSSRKSSD